MHMCNQISSIEKACTFTCYAEANGALSMKFNWSVHIVTTINAGYVLVNEYCIDI